MDAAVTGQLNARPHLDVGVALSAQAAKAVTARRRTIVEAAVDAAMKRILKWRDAHHLTSKEIDGMKTQSIQQALRKPLQHGW